MGAFDFDSTITTGSVVQIKPGGNNLVVDYVFNGLAWAHWQTPPPTEQLALPLYQLIKIS